MIRHQVLTLCTKSETELHNSMTSYEVVSWGRCVTVMCSKENIQLTSMINCCITAADNRYRDCENWDPEQRTPYPKDRPSRCVVINCKSTQYSGPPKSVAHLKSTASELRSAVCYDLLIPQALPIYHSSRAAKRQKLVDLLSHADER